MVVSSAEPRILAEQAQWLASGLAKVGHEVRVCQLRHTRRGARGEGPGRGPEPLVPRPSILTPHPSSPTPRPSTLDPYCASHEAQAFACDPRTIWRLRKQLVHYQPAIVHTWGANAGLIGAAASRGHARWVASGLSIEPRQPRSARLANWLIARIADRVVVDTPAARQRLAESAGMSEKVCVAPYAAACAAQPSKGRETVLAGLGLPADAQTVGIICPLLACHQTKELFWAFELLRVAHPRARLILLGDGPQKAQLARFARLIGISASVHFVCPGGLFGADEVIQGLDVLWAADASLHLSPGIMSAMAAGTPVVALDGAGSRLLIESERSGYLMSSLDRAAFVRLTLKLLKDPALARQIGSTAKQRIGHDFSPAAMTETVSNVYRDLLDTPGSS